MIIATIAKLLTCKYGLQQAATENIYYCVNPYTMVFLYNSHMIIICVDGKVLRPESWKTMHHQLIYYYDPHMFIKLESALRVFTLP